MTLTEPPYIMGAIMQQTLRRLLVPAIAAFQLAGILAAQTQPALTRHLHEPVRMGTAKRVGQLPLDQVMQLNVVLPASDQIALDAFVRDVSDPTSPLFRHFLTVAEFTERFGPSQADYDALVQFLRTNGFEVVGGTREALNVQVKGPVSAVQTAFHVNINTYQHPSEDRIFYSPDREPTVALPFPLWHVSGLDNFSTPHPLYVSKTEFAAAHGMQPEQLVNHATTGSGPQSSFLGSDMRAAYSGGTALTGAGQTLGLLEFVGTDVADLNTYYSNVHQTNQVPITLVSTDGTSTSCTYKQHHCDDTEQTLDMTQALGIAPGLAHLIMFVGSTDTAIIGAMTTYSPLPATIGCSWGWTPADPKTLNLYFEKMAAQGQTFFVASGDNSTWSKSGSSEAWPADNAYIVSVGQMGLRFRHGSNTAGSSIQAITVRRFIAMAPTLRQTRILHSTFARIRPNVRQTNTAEPALLPLCGPGILR